MHTVLRSLPDSKAGSTLLGILYALRSQSVLPASAKSVLCEWQKQILLCARANLLQSLDKLLLPTRAVMLRPGEESVLHQHQHLLQWRLLSPRPVL